MRGQQLVRRVEVPVALPVILGGVRSAAVQVVATLTLAAIFGGPGLGRYLVEGIAQVDDGMVFGGVVLVAALSLATEAVVRAPAADGLPGPRDADTGGALGSCRRPRHRATLDARLTDPDTGLSRYIVIRSPGFRVCRATV